MGSPTSVYSLRRLGPKLGALAAIAFAGLLSGEALAQECSKVFDDSEIYPASGGILDRKLTMSPTDKVYVKVPLLPVDSTSYSGTFLVQFMKPGSASVVLEFKTKEDIFEGNVPAGRYELVVTHSTHKLVAPRRFITVQKPEDGSGVLTIPTYISRTPIPYFRMDRSLIPFKTEEDLIAVVFQAEPPDDLPNADDPIITPEAKKLADKISGNPFGLEPIDPAHPDSKLRKLRYVSAHGTVWMFKLDNASMRLQAMAYLRTQLPRPARMGIPINLRDGNFHVLDNFFVVSADESVVTNSNKFVATFIENASPVQWLTPKKLRKKLDNRGLLLIKFDESRNLCENIHAIEKAHGQSMYGEPDLLALLSDADPSLPVNWPGDKDYADAQIKLHQAHELQHIRQAWEAIDARNAAGKVIITSADVHVATVDMGIDPKDEDIDCDSSSPGSRQLAICYDYPKGIACKRQSKHSHGMSVFGIVSACAENGVGPAGIAPGAHHIAISRPFYTATTTYADALRYVGGIAPSCWESLNTQASNPCPKSPLAKPADIISNSHSFSWDPVSSTPVFSPATGYELPVATSTAFELLVTEGRSGRGTVLVYAAANSPPGISPRSADLHEPLARDPRAIGVANCWWSSVNNSVAPHPTSNFGTSLDVCGIGNGSVTIRGACDSQVNPCPFGGTSAATPTVAGVVALMLSVNRCLKWDDIRNAIVLNVTPVLNGSGYGTGLIKAEAAVAAALNVPANGNCLP